MLSQIAYYRNHGLGSKAVAIAVAHKVFGFPRHITAKVPPLSVPVTLRVHTSDLQALEWVIVKGEYDFNLPFVPRTIVDAGANIGLASLFFASKYSGAKIVSIEAERGNFEMLVRNARAFPNIEPVHAALWSTDGLVRVSLPSKRRGEWGFVTTDNTGELVPSLSMPSFLEEAGFGTVDILKVDIEGAEVELFSEHGWLSRVRSIMIETHDRFRPGCSDAVQRATGGFFRAETRGSTQLYLRSDARTTVR